MRELPHGCSVGRYVIEEHLGRGGMGSVYRAFDPVLQRPLAIKVLHSDDVDRAVREGRAVASLHHPNIITIYEVAVLDGPDGPLPILAMELVRGRSLRGAVSDATVGLERRMEYLIGIARGLAAAHDAGILHRDIKPDNVVVDEHDVVKLLDFGIAGRVTSTTTSSSGDVTPIGGTPRYMAPECLSAGGVAPDARSDQFAWGVLAYELLTGASPWGQTRDLVHLALVIATCEVDHAPLARLPNHWASAVLRALAKARVDRFPSMHALLDAVDTHTLDTVGVDKLTVAAVPHERPRRWPWVVAVFALACAIVLSIHFRRGRAPANLPSAPIASSTPVLVTSPIVTGPIDAAVAPEHHDDGDAGPQHRIGSYVAGDRVRVLWEGYVFPARILAVLPNEQFRVRYDDYGSEWDEVVTKDRINPSGHFPVGVPMDRGASAPVCGYQETNCNGTCVNLLTSNAHCGSCFHGCGVRRPLCKGGMCDCYESEKDATGMCPH